MWRSTQLRRIGALSRWEATLKSGTLRSSKEYIEGQIKILKPRINIAA